MKKINFSDKFGLTEAVLSRRKTQTRRISSKFISEIGFNRLEIFNGTELRCYNEAGTFIKYKLPYQIGEVVAVAQSYNDFYNDECDPRQFPSGAGWTNKMFVRADLMPHQIRITNVRVERLNDITEADCIAEGIYQDECTGYFNGYAFEISKDQHGNILAKKWYKTPREAFAALIDRISGKGTWQSNPYVFVYDFELVK